MNRFYFLFVFVLTAFTISIAQNYPKNRDIIRDFEKSRFDNQKSFHLSADNENQSQYDITFYDLFFDLDPVSQLLTGKTLIQGKSTVDGFDMVEIDLGSTMMVDSVLQDGASLSYTHQNGKLNVQLPAAINNGDYFHFTVHYFGNPQTGGLGTFGWDLHGGQHIIWTLSQPFGAKEWWPCKDDPNDKADSVFVAISVPNYLVATSNGLLVDVDSSGADNDIYYWQTRYPISTYLVAVTVSNYAHFTDWYYSAAGDSMQLHYYVYPEHLSAAMEDFNITDEMIEFFAGVFGEYPFIDEKYGMVTFPWSGAMEHQTLTSYGSPLITGTHDYDFINAHELAHQWFGDCITMRRWSHIWLNEGFASYAEALWIEHINGMQAYHDYMASQDPGRFSGSLFVYDSTNVNALFSNTVYDKGSWTLHMLRGVLGDSVFFSGMSSYTNDTTLMYKSAETGDFRRIMEETAGINLDWFFEQWIYHSGRPNYFYNWNTSPGETGFTTTLNIIQSNPEPFKMPVQIELAGAGFDTVITIWDSLGVQQFSIQTDFQPAELYFDPDNWILKTLTEGYAYNVSGHVLNAADSSGIENAYVLWEGPYDPITGAALNFGIDSTNADGQFSMTRTSGVYAFIAAHDSFVQSKISFMKISNDTAGIDLYLTKPILSFDRDSLVIKLQDVLNYDTLLTFSNSGSGPLLLNFVEGKYPALPFPTQKNRFSSSQFPAREIYRNAANINRVCSAFAENDWQHIFSDPKEFSGNPFDVSDIYFQKTEFLLNFKLHFHEAGTGFNSVRINVFLDTDNDPATGIFASDIGADYLVAIGNFGGGVYGYLLEWNEQVGDFIFMGPVSSFASSIAQRNINVGLSQNLFPGISKINLFVNSYNISDFTSTMDYIPDSNLGHLSVTSADVSWLKIAPLFSIIESDSSADILVSINSTDLNTGLYESGITASHTAPLIMETNVLPLALNYITTSIEHTDGLIPHIFSVGDNYPNPFNPSTFFKIALPQAEIVKIGIFNILGQNIFSQKTQLPAGYHIFSWNGKDLSNTDLPSGVYFFRLEAGENSALKKIILIR